MEATEQETFGVYTDVSQAVSDTGYRSITLLTSRGESMFGQAASVYWSLTPDEARALGGRLIYEAGRARGMDDREAVEPVEVPSRASRRTCFGMGMGG